MALQATFTAPVGVFGNLVSMQGVFVEGAPDLVITVTDGTHILLEIGTTGGSTNLTWDAIAALFNADPDASSLATMVGEVGSQVVSSSAVGPLSEGSYGLGAGQFFAGGLPAPPTSEIEVDIVFCGVVRYMIREEGSAA